MLRGLLLAEHLQVRGEGGKEGGRRMEGEKMDRLREGQRGIKARNGGGAGG